MIGWLDQFGTELPVKVSTFCKYSNLVISLPHSVFDNFLLRFEQSDVSGEVLKLLIDDGGTNLTIVSWSVCSSTAS